MPYPQALLAWSSLHVLDKRRYDVVLDVFGSLEKAFPLVNLEFLKQLGLKEETAQRALLRLEEFDPAAYQARLEKEGIRFLFLEDPEYPSLLKHLSDPPVFLYVKGSVESLNKPTIGLVGTREMTLYGKRVTQEFVTPFIRAGFTTVSGLALGVDTEAAEQTLRDGGLTAAVLGHGFGTIFPASNEKLSKRIVETGGCLVTEYPFDFASTTYTFPARNRIIAGLCKATIVLQAPVKSGALITASLALEEGRDVYAVPGDVFDEGSSGCNMLIAQNKAKLAVSADDILRDLGVIAPAADAPAFKPDSIDEKAAWEAMTSLPQTVDELVLRSGLAPASLSVALTLMELKGAVRNVGGGQWVRA